MDSQELIKKVRYYIGKKKSAEEIAELLGIERYQVYGIVQELINQGYLYKIINGSIIKLNKAVENKNVYQIKNELEHIRLLLISDTHLCSKYDRLDILRYLYEKAGETKTNYVLHSGDFTDGKSTRPEHIYELRALSYTGQVDYCVENYPKIEGLNTYVISGNHDDWWTKSTGSEIVKSIADKREDIIYLGPDMADLKLGKLKIHLFHGKGGIAYAKSYKAQKYLDTMPIEMRPHILQLGHIHQAFFYQQDYTSVFQTGCLEDQTPFIRSMGLNGERSCWWVDCYMDDKGNPVKIKPELEVFGPKKIRKK